MLSCSFDRMHLTIVTVSASSTGLVTSSPMQLQQFQAKPLYVIGRHAPNGICTAWQPCRRSSNCCSAAVLSCEPLRIQSTHPFQGFALRCCSVLQTWRCWWPWRTCRRTAGRLGTRWWPRTSCAPASPMPRAPCCARCSWTTVRSRWSLQQLRCDTCAGRPGAAWANAGRASAAQHSAAQHSMHSGRSAPACIWSCALVQASQSPL